MIGRANLSERIGVAGIAALALVAACSGGGSPDGGSSQTGGSGGGEADAQGVGGSVGGACAKNNDCPSGLCLAVGVCSKLCASPSDCPPGPEWTCRPLPGVGNLCQCAASSQDETCDGRDNDCDGVVDDGATCPAGRACQNGQCLCAQGLSDCSGACVDTSSDVQHCGDCSHACGGANGTPTCSGGHCAVACSSGFGDCDGDPENGCETDTTTSTGNCGSCGGACDLPHAVPGCVAASCVPSSCEATYGDCDGIAANGCETELVDDTANCGGCGTACPFVCLQGVCGGNCVPGSKQCSGTTPQSCQADGTWLDGQPCANGCLNGLCGQGCTGAASQACGDCGTQSRTCNNGVWSAWGTCESKCGPLEECFNAEFCVAKKVTVTGGYAIDATEVTLDQYAAWLSTNPSTAGQPSYCTWNTDFVPPWGWPPAANDAHPVGQVDWCDAYAYCKAVGKRMCGKIGGGPNGFTDFASPTKSQWFNACTSGGQNDYVYGDTYSAMACNVDDAGNGATVPVGTMLGCTSGVPGFTGVYDLSGNVYEWEDSCDAATGAADHCLLRGGSFSYEDSLRCDQVNSDIGHRQARLQNIGIRCCAP